MNGEIGNKDVLDNEVSAEVGLTQSVFRAKIHSRAVSAFDWLLGCKVQGRGLDTVAENKLIETINSKAIANLENDPELIQAAVGNLRSKFLRHYKNKEAVAAEAQKNIETESQKAGDESGESSVSEEFMEEFEPYAEKASTEALREKWGKVLAGEIRKPGTFSRKVMRIVDEVDTETAELFQNLCRYRLGDAIPICLVKKLNFAEQNKLENSGLLIPYGLLEKISRPFTAAHENQGKENEKAVWFMGAGNLGFSIPHGIKRTASETDIIAFNSDDKEAPGILVYALTDAGQALASIFEDKQQEALYAYIKKLSELMPDVEVKEYNSVREGQARLLRIWKNGKPLTEEFRGFGAYHWGGGAL